MTALPDPGLVDCVVFDLDGTLVESRPAIAGSINFALASLARPPLAVDAVARHIGWGLDELLLRILGPDSTPALIAEATRLYRDHYRATCVAATTVLPTVSEALATLRTRGFRLGVATNKPSGFAHQVLDGLGLGQHFDAVVGADDVRAPKPDPEMLLRAIASLGSRAERSLYVGDMQIDVATAAAGGVGFVGVSTGNLDAAGLRQVGAGRVVERLAELAVWLGNAKNGDLRAAETGPV